MKKFTIILAFLIIFSAACDLPKTPAQQPVNSNAISQPQQQKPQEKKDIPLAANVVIDKIEILKSERKMTVYSKGQKLKTYTIALGPQPIGPKQFEGDGKTPEGIYKVDGKNPNSLYHKNLGVSYPSERDRAYAKTQGKSPGGDIKIHGIGKTWGYLGSAHALSDWTLGCIAVTNEEIDEIYSHTPVGAKIEIKP